MAVLIRYLPLLRLRHDKKLRRTGVVQGMSGGAARRAMEAATVRQVSWLEFAKCHG